MLDRSTPVRYACCGPSSLGVISSHMIGDALIPWRYARTAFLNGVISESIVELTKMRWLAIQSLNRSSESGAGCATFSTIRLFQVEAAFLLIIAATSLIQTQVEI